MGRGHPLSGISCLPVGRRHGEKKIIGAWSSPFGDFLPAGRQAPRREKDYRGVAQFG
ncbi:MAG: hypothetical protein ABIG56_04345 [Candidatus Omnitrophota bacterium]